MHNKSQNYRMNKNATRESKSVGMGVTHGKAEKFEAVFLCCNFSFNLV